MAGFVDSTVKDIDNRLEELKQEVTKLEAARAALVGARRGPGHRLVPRRQLLRAGRRQSMRRPNGAVGAAQGLVLSPEAGLFFVALGQRTDLLVVGPARLLDCGALLLAMGARPALPAPISRKSSVCSKTRTGKPLRANA